MASSVSQKKYEVKPCLVRCIPGKEIAYAERWEHGTWCHCGKTNSIWKISSSGWEQVDLTVYFHASACWVKWEGLFPGQCSSNTNIYIMCNKLGKLVKWNICSACLNTEARSGYEFPLHFLDAMMMSWEWVWKVHVFLIKKFHCFFSIFIIIICGTF